MSNFKTYQAQTWIGMDEFCINVEIDHEKLTDDKLHLINDFWSDSAERLSLSNGNIVEAVVRHLLITVYEVNCRYPNSDIQRIFKESHATEGWPAMDGSGGIRLVYHSPFELPEFCNVEFKEVTA